MLTENIVFFKGDTFKRVVYWEGMPLVSKPVTAITQEAPAKVQCVGHGLTNGWRAALAGVKGMTEINASRWPPQDRDFSPVRVVDVDNVLLENVNSAEYTAYTSGGFLVYYTPKSLVGFTASFKVWDKQGSLNAPLLELTHTDGITLSDPAKTILITVTDERTQAMGWKSGYFELMLTDVGGEQTKIMKGLVRVEG